MCNIFIAFPFHGRDHVDEDLKTLDKAICVLQSWGLPEGTEFLTGYTKPDDIRMHNPLDGMCYAFFLMGRCNRFVFLPGWEKARGCRLEHQILTDYGYTVEYITQEELDKF